MATPDTATEEATPEKAAMSADATPETATEEAAITIGASTIGGSSLDHPENNTTIRATTIGAKSVFEMIELTSPERRMLAILPAVGRKREKNFGAPKKLSHLHYRAKPPASTHNFPISFVSAFTRSFDGNIAHLECYVACTVFFVLGRFAPILT